MRSEEYSEQRALAATIREHGVFDRDADRWNTVYAGQLWYWTQLIRMGEGASYELDHRVAQST